MLPVWPVAPVMTYMVNLLDLNLMNTGFDAGGRFSVQ
jgi:hypothetical protein